MRRSILFVCALLAVPGCTTAGDDCAERDWYLDADGDGFGRDDEVRAACERPPGYAEVGGDCNDGEPAVRPGAVEACNGGRDDDCDGLADDADDDVDGVRWFLDRDGDGFGSAERAVVACTRPDFAVDDALDCDDDDAEVNPAAIERCNGVDDDCDPETIEGGVWFRAANGTWTDETATFSAATPSAPLEYTAPGEGSLFVCPGTWRARILGSQDLALIGPGGATATTLDAGYIQAESRAAAVEGTTGFPLTVQGVTLNNAWSGVQHADGPLVLRDVAITRLGGRGGEAVRLENGSIDVDGLVVDGGGALIGVRLDEVVGTLRNVALRNLDSVAHTFRLLLSDVDIEDLEVTDNVSRRGGGLAIRSSVVDVVRGTIARNEASLNGGGIYVEPYSEVRDEEGPPSEVTLEEVTLVDNVAQGRGGGLYAEGTADVTLTDSLLRGNDCAGTGPPDRVGGTLSAGAALDFAASGVLVLDRTTLSDHTCMVPRNAVLAASQTDAVIRCVGVPDEPVGFFRNVCRYVVAAVSFDPTASRFEAVDCDFGTGEDDNVVALEETAVRVRDPEDFEWNYDDRRESLGDDETFCSGLDCP